VLHHVGEIAGVEGMAIVHASVLRERPCLPQAIRLARWTPR
jgi:hypothetical protein